MVSERPETCHRPVTPGGTVVAFGGTIADSGFGTADRFINDLAIQVPEPATLTLLAAGLAIVLLGTALHRVTSAAADRTDRQTPTPRGSS